MEALIAILAEHGLPGVIIGALGFGYWKKDQQLNELNKEIRHTANESARATIALETAIKIMEARNV